MQALVLSLSLLTLGGVLGQECLIENGDFSSWYPVDGVNKPAQWDLAIGNTQEGSPGSTSTIGVSTVSSGLVLQGNSGTTVWNYVGQAVAGAPPPSCRYTLEFRARADTVLSPGQRDNCYVGLWALGAGGSPVDGGVSIVTVDSVTEVHALTYLHTPAAAASVEARIFLSKTGYLDVTSVCVRCGTRFDVLKEVMGRYYSFFQLKGIDWVAFSAPHRAAIDGAATPAALRAALTDLLAGLKDPHVRIVTPEKLTPYDTWSEDNIVLNYIASGGLDSIHSTLEPTTLRTFPAGSQVPYAVVSRLKGRPDADVNPAGYGYVLACTFPDPDDATWADFLGEVRGLASAPGIVIDVRCNRGGNELAARQLAEVFAEREYIYARQRYRSGPGASEFAAATDAAVGPGPGTPYTKPVVVLTGAVCMSSCEGFVLMMKAMPHATLLGLPTRGASGNPAPVVVDPDLGVEVYFSRWVREHPSGVTFEGTGIAPDVRVEWGGDAETAGGGVGDGTLEAGIAEAISMAAGGPMRGAGPPPPPGSPVPAPSAATRAGAAAAGLLLAVAAAVLC